MNYKVALITGSSHGIGAGIATHLAQHGYDIVVTYLKDTKAGEAVCREIESYGVKTLLSQLDVTSEESVKAVLDLIAEKYDHLDVLVNNAAVDKPTPIETCSFDEWTRITRTKIDGNFLCTKYALPLLKESDNANIIIIMSALGDKPDPEDSAYSVGTAGTVSFMKAMTLALSKYKIRVNGVGPSETPSNLEYWKIIGESPEMWEKLAKENPLGRTTTVDDIGRAVVMIVEDEGKFINGNILYVTGGNHLK